MLGWLTLAWMALQHVKENVASRRIVEIAQMLVWLLIFLLMLGAFGHRLD